jgi:hypothetical protein
VRYEIAASIKENGCRIDLLRQPLETYRSSELAYGPRG